MEGKKLFPLSRYEVSIQSGLYLGEWTQYMAYGFEKPCRARNQEIGDFPGQNHRRERFDKMGNIGG